MYAEETNRSDGSGRLNSGRSAGKNTNREDVAKEVADNINRWLGLVQSPKSKSQGGITAGSTTPGTVPPKKNKKVIAEWARDTVEDDWDEWSGAPVADLDDDEDVAELPGVVQQPEMPRVKEVEAAVREDDLPAARP